MRAADYLKLALRSLRRSRLRSGLTVSAILIGATGITIMLTFVTSVKAYVQNQFVQTGQIDQIQVSETPNLTYNPNGETGGGGLPQTQGNEPTLTDALEAKIAAVPDVTGVAATAQGLGNQQLAYLEYNGHRLSINNLSDYVPNGVIEPPLVAGRDLRASDTSNEILLTSDYADALGFKGNYKALVGKTVTLQTQPGYTGVGATLPLTLPPQPSQCTSGQPPPPGTPCGPTAALPAMALSAVVVGITRATDSRETISMPLSWALAIGDGSVPTMMNQNCQLMTVQCSPANENKVQSWQTPPPAQYLADRGGYGSFIVKVNDTANIPAVTASIDHLGVSAASGIDALNKQKRKADVVGLILGALGLVALLIAALGVMNTMVMSVLERTREIGVMRALGARRSTIRRLFVAEAAGLGFFGGLLGVGIGYGIVLLAKPVIEKTVQSNAELSATNFSVPVWLVVAVLAGTTLIGVISGLLPARRAARLDPVDALRYE
jgi:ABC-type antimicrobial peptide transport system permease subunit